MALILHSTDYFMLHFAPCRCSMSFIMISILVYTKNLASRPSYNLSYLFSCSDDGDDDDEKYIFKRGRNEALNQGKANNNSFVTINKPERKIVEDRRGVKHIIQLTYFALFFVVLPKISKGEKKKFPFFSVPKLCLL